MSTEEELRILKEAIKVKEKKDLKRREEEVILQRNIAEKQLKEATIKLEKAIEQARAEAEVARRDAEDKRLQLEGKSKKK